MKKKSSQPENSQTSGESSPLNEPVESDSQIKSEAFPIVGIGASAGGLQALDELFANVPYDSGMAFIVIQHLSPTHESSMPELLKRNTKMPVLLATDGIAVQPNTVYVIPPNRNLSILRGSLQLFERDLSSLQHPIDFFLKALAQDQGSRAIAIILSGTGSDGTLGSRVIKAEAGMVIAQSLDSATYDGMPRSVIESGLADYILAPQQMPQQLIDYVTRIVKVGAVAAAVPTEKNTSELLPKIVTIVRNQTGHDFSAYKQSTLIRRIERRMAVNQIDSSTVYLRFLQDHPEEATILFKEFLINVTSFFRDSEAFDVLKEKLKELIQQKPPENPIRVWVVGCSTGEEAYSIAIILRECLEEMEHRQEAQVFATDLDTDAIALARSGVYPDSISADVTETRLKKFFTNQDSTFRVNRAVRDMVVFAPHNVIKDPPFMKMDLVSARNVLIYLSGDLQKRLLPLLHYSLNPEGLLFLSPSETIGEFANLFTVLDRKWKLYRRKEAGKLTLPILPSLTYPGVKTALATGRREGENTGRSDISSLTNGLLLNDYAPPCVMVDGAYNILYVHGETGKFLQLATGRTSVNILEMAHKDLRAELTAALRKASTQKKEISREGVVIGSNSHTYTLTLTVRPVNLSGQGDSFLVVFRDVHRAEKVEKSQAKNRPEGGDQRADELEKELKSSQERLQSTVEELAGANEELKSSNEELLSTVEEVQSTNEELETSREELRSMNEELTTVNSENQTRIEQLIRARNDLRNLLNTMSVATLFLDTELNINSYTPAATKLFKLRETDTGRPLTDISTNLTYDKLVEDAREVVRSLVPRETEVQDRDGKWFSMRIMPYRTEENAVVGLVVTFLDIDARRVLQAALSYTRNIIDTVRESILILDKDLTVVTANRPFYQVFRTNERETLGHLVFELGNHQWDIPRLRELMEKILPSNASFDNFSVEHEFPLIGHRKMLLNARRLYEELGEEKILLAIEDVTRQPPAEKVVK